MRGKVAVECVGSTVYSRHEMRGRVANYLSYLALAVPRALALNADVILAMTDPPVAGLAGALVARLGGKPFVYNIRDLYPDMALGGEIVRPSRWVERWESMHRRALRQAARVIVLGDDMRQRILAKGVAAERVVVVRDGATFAAVSAAQTDPVVQEIRGGFPFVALHAGNLGFYGAWETLLKAAALLRNENMGLVFIGDGANRAALEVAAQGSGAGNVRLHGVSANRANAAGDDGRGRAYRNGEARAGRDCGAEQTLFDPGGGASGAGGGGGAIGCCADRGRMRLRACRRPRRSGWRRRGAARTSRRLRAAGGDGAARPRNRGQIC